MVKHGDRVAPTPRSYISSLPPSLLGPAARRATKTANRRDEESGDVADLQRWESEGGAVASRVLFQERYFQRKPVRSGIGALPNHDSPLRSAVKARMTEVAANAGAIASRGPDSGNEPRSRRLASPYDNASPKPNQRRGRRTMARHGNRP